MNSRLIHHRRLSALSMLCIVALGYGCGSSGQRTYVAPNDAVEAMITAARSDSMDQLERIFGPDSTELLRSGDEVEDGNRRAEFMRLYDERHAMEPGMDEGTMMLVVGNDEWPFPVPLVENEKGKWYFDTAAGLDEIINRRIGRNELATIQVCLALVDAQREYAMNDCDGDGARDYAQKLLSEPGNKDGLYWETAEGEEPSPMGPFVATAADEGYRRSDEPQPYHGYYYRLLKSQGPEAQGGAFDYIVKDKMIGGFAVVAYPAEYGNSGVMSFIVSHAGVVYECDLGEQSAEIAKSMVSFNPGAEWEAVEIEITQE